MVTDIKARTGQYYYTSWGYDQTNIDYLVVVKVSPSGKTAICRMAHPIRLGEQGHEDVFMPGEGWGIEFQMKIREDGNLRGSYPFCSIQDSRRLDTFYPVKLGDTHNQTMPEFGH